MKIILSVVLATAVSALASIPCCADGPDVKPDIDATKVKIHIPEMMSTKFDSQGMTLTTNSEEGSEWYWSQGGGDAWDNSDAQAFSLDPSKNQSVLSITVVAISPGATLLVGAFLFDAGGLKDGKSNQILGTESGGLNINAPGTYTFDVGAAVTTAGISGATAWKPHFWFSEHGAIGQSITISSISVTSKPADTGAPANP